MKDKIVVIVIAVAVSFGLFWSFMPQGSKPLSLGAADRSTITNPWTFNESVTIEGDTNVDNFVNGGASMATTTNGAGTFTAAQVCDNNLIVATPEVGSVTLTFPTTAQLVADCLPTAGDEKTIRLQNASTTGTAILTLADGANGDHQEQEGATTVVDVNEWAEITFMNIDGTNHMMLVTITQVAD